MNFKSLNQMNYSINCKGKLLDLSQPKIMGILNLTPDSFFDGGKYSNEKDVLIRVEKMLKEGANVIDIGGMSSRPGAAIISVEEELNRVIKNIENIRKEFPSTIISIDTVRAKVAKEAVGVGSSIINDISAGKIDDKMYATVAELDVPYILMHMQGRPETMQEQPIYTKSIIEDVTDFFIKEIGQLRKLKVKDIVLDVGFGFGKTIKHNYQLLGEMAQFQILDLPVLAGISRKSMIWRLLDITPDKALNGTSVLNFKALQQGASILRVHDVNAAKEVIKLWEQFGN